MFIVGGIESLELEFEGRLEVKVIELLLLILMLVDLELLLGGILLLFELVEFFEGFFELIFELEIFFEELAYVRLEIEVALSGDGVAFEFFDELLLLLDLELVGFVVFFGVLELLARLDEAVGEFLVIIDENF